MDKSFQQHKILTSSKPILPCSGAGKRRYSEGSMLCSTADSTREEVRGYKNKKFPPDYAGLFVL